MSVTAAIRRMIDAGLTVEQALLAAEAFEAVGIKDEQAERRRAKDRERKRLRNSAESAESAESVEGAEPPPLDKEKPPTPPKEINPPLTPRAALETVLDSVRAGAVVDHRKKLGKPLTPHAAHLLATKLSRWPDPNFAADEMIANGWQGFKPEWLEKQQPRAASPPSRPAPRNAGERATMKLKAQSETHDPPSPPTERLAAGDGNRQASMSGIARQFAGKTIDLARTG